MNTIRASARILPMLVLTISLNACMGKTFKIGVIDGKLIDCPSTPNCISSMAEASDDHYTEPMPFAIPASTVISQAATVVEGMRLTEVKVQNKNYLHAIYLTTFLRFVDDVEFLIDRDASVLHVRSASREGYSDFGTNRRRVEKIKSQLQPLLSGTAK